jgi:SAM-dependent methyltransferase
MIYDVFSARWFATFLAPIPPERTEAEVDFVVRHLPPVRFPRLLDLCCGPARHARGLAARGFQVVGVDRHEPAIEAARALRIAGAEFHAGDMRALDALLPGAAFDGIVNLWHSFGYFDDETNQAVLRSLARLVRPGGRAIFDIYNRDHMVGLPSREVAERDGLTIETTRRWEGNRLTVHLRYSDAAAREANADHSDAQSENRADRREIREDSTAAAGEDRFEWRLYTPAEFQQACEDAGFACLVACAWFDDQRPASSEHARMQFVLERQ